MKTYLFIIDDGQAEFYCDTKLVKAIDLSNLSEKTMSDSEQYFSYLINSTSGQEIAEEDERKEIRKAISSYGHQLFKILVADELQPVLHGLELNLIILDKRFKNHRWEMLNNGNGFLALSGCVRYLRQLSDKGTDYSSAIEDELKFSIFTSSPKFPENIEPPPLNCFGLPESVPFENRNCHYHLYWDICSRLTPRKLLKETPELGPNVIYLSGYCLNGMLVLENPETQKMELIEPNELKSAFKKMVEKRADTRNSQLEDSY